MGHHILIDDPLKELNVNQQDAQEIFSLRLTHIYTLYLKKFLYNQDEKLLGSKDLGVNV